MTYSPQGGNRMDTAHKFAKGLEASTITWDFLNDNAAATVIPTLRAAYGTTVTCVIKQTSSAVSATNPSYTASVLINNLQNVNGAVGDISNQSLTFTCNSTVAVAVA